VGIRFSLIAFSTVGVVIITYIATAFKREFRKRSILLQLLYRTWGIIDGYVAKRDFYGAFE